MNTNKNNAFFLNEINEMSKLDKNLLVQMSEEMYHSQITELGDMITKNSDIKIILLAGPSSSGKTTTSLLISKELEKSGKKCLTVSLDDFFLDREQTPLLPNGNYDYENVTAIDLELFNEFIDKLLNEKKAYMPSYNFITGKKERQKLLVECDNETYVIIEGLHALNPVIINQPKNTQFKVYLCPISDFVLGDDIVLSYNALRLLRRCIRDLNTRGRTIEETLDGWEEVCDGEKKYIDPYKNTANYSIDSTHMYEPLIYATELLPKLESCNKETAKQLVLALSNCEKLDKNIIPKNSLLNEFVK